MDTGVANEGPVLQPVEPVRRRRARWLLVALATAALAGYVLVGLPGNGFPGRAGPSELRRVEDAINRAYQECGRAERATINWFWGQVEVPSTNGIVGNMPNDVELTIDELGHATGTRNFFWLVCPS